MTTTVLKGRFVRLEPLKEAHREGLRAAAQDERIWEFNIVSAFGEGFESWFHNALTMTSRWSYTVIADERIVGSSSFLDLTPAHRRTEIGHTWFHPSAWGTPLNVETKLLMMGHAFEALNLTRVSFNVDAINLRSRKAVEKLGALQEGLLRRHAITYTGRVRDTVVYSILREEWPSLRERLQSRL